MTAEARPAHERSLLARLSVAVWLGFVAYPLTAAYAAPGRSVLHLVVVGVVAAVFCAAYITYCALPDHVRADLDRGRLLGFVGVVVGAVTFLVFYDGPAWDYSYVYAVWPVMGLVGSRLWAPPLVLTLIAVGIGGRAGLGDAALLGVAIEVLGVSAGLYGVTHLVAANQALHRAQVQFAAAAVAEERLRFSRDLHELLGHSLSVIALKSQVASRLALDQPQRAVTEMKEIEQITRQALQEVRDAVSGYRRASLAVELQAARRALAAANIGLQEAITVPVLAESVEAPLAWALREGVTNVVRHSRASTCTLTLERGPREVALTIADDGVGPPSGAQGAAGGGNGLRGLAERVAAAGGVLEAGRPSGGGFRLQVVIPLPTAPSTLPAGGAVQSTEGAR